MTVSMPNFAFVHALTLPSASGGVRTRSTFLCGGATGLPATARVRSVRPAHLSWRACAEKPAPTEPTAAVAVPEVPEAALAVPEAEPAVAVPEPEAAEPAVAVPETEAVATPPAPAGDEASDEALGERRDRRNRRRRKQRREVTLPLVKMEIGMELEGVVKSVTSYGAFIGEMGTPTDGLLHVSQLSSSFVENVTDIVQVGDKVKVHVTDINLEKGNFSLSMKPLPIPADAPAAVYSAGSAQEQPHQSRREQTRAKWEAFKYDDEVFIDAQVVSIADFGCFCKLLDGEGKPDSRVPTEGLVHISEVSTERIERMTDVVQVDQVVKVRVVGIDKKRSRISLSMKDKSASREGGGGGRDSSVTEELRKANESQPTFKTSFELAFERAGLKVEA